MEKTIMEYLSEQALKQPQASVIMSPLSEDLTYGRLHLHVQTVAAFLRSKGINHHNRVAVIFPSGAELAAVIVSVLACAVCVPINPSYSAEEIKSSLHSLKVDAVILPEGSVHFDVCSKLAIPVFVACRDTADPAGLFKLSDMEGMGYIEDWPEQDDVAIIFHTSGTTSVPKVVPLTHRNICYPIPQYIDHFGLSPRDRIMGTIPLFYTFGVAQMLKMTIASGSSAVFLQDHSVKTILSGLKEYKATRFAAGPTTLDAVAEYIKRSSLPQEEYSLRFVLTGGAAVKPETSEALEAYFKVPVIAHYGMSEIGEALACAPLPPRKRFFESVGVILHGEMAVMDEKGCILPHGERGEIVARGPGVFSGYENYEGINVEAFAHGWFHTGDQGYIDSNGYLFLTGRLKEIINKGGQKVSPTEVEHWILKLPGVKEAACFPCPHPTLGEDVSIAIVLNSNALLTVADIRRMLRTTLADFKIPSRIIFVDAIPKNSNGKVKRNALYKILYECEPKKLEPAPYVAPRNSLESELVGIWQEILHKENIGIDDNFFELGGDSLLVTNLLVNIETRWGKVLPASVLIESGTVAELATIISTNITIDKMVAIQPNGSLPPIFCIHALDGDVMQYRNFTPYFGLDQPIYAIRFVVDNKRVKIEIPDLAAEYISLIRSIQTLGPYRLIGHSFGGVVAYEMARQLTAAGQNIELLALIDTASPRYFGSVKYNKFANRFAMNLLRVGKNWHRLLAGEFGSYLTGYIRRTFIRSRQNVRSTDDEPETFSEFEENLKSVVNKYVPTEYSGEVILYRAAKELEKHALYYERCLGWSKYIHDKLRIVEVPGTHHSLVNEPNVGVLANKIKETL